MAESTDKVTTILVGDGLHDGAVFTVVGRASGIAEARKMCRAPEFIRKHMGDKPHGAFVLLVSSSGHNVFLPIGALFAEQRDGG